MDWQRVREYFSSCGILFSNCALFIFFVDEPRPRMHCADAAGLCNELSLIDCSPSPWRKKTSVSSRHTANEVHAGTTSFFFLTLVKAYNKFRSTVDAASRTGKLLHDQGAWVQVLQRYSPFRKLRFLPLPARDRAYALCPCVELLTAGGFVCS